MTRMQKKMMMTNMRATWILKVMTRNVLRIKTFVIGKISNQMSSCISMLAIFTITQCAIKSKKAFQETICLKTVPIVDQVVIAKTSKGESQGSAFVKVCWDLNMSIAYYRSVETGDKILEDPHAYK